MKGRDILYTRSYPRQENKKEFSPPEQPFNTSPPRKVLTENEIPEGYSGTAILRENDNAKTVREEPCGDAHSTAHISPSRAQIHTKKFKVATKITPSLWRDGEDKTDTPVCEKQKEQLYDVLCEETVAEGRKKGIAYTDYQKNAAFEDTENCDSLRENAENDACKKECDEERGNEKERRRSRPHKRSLLRLNAETHCFKRTPAVSLRDCSFSLEDLLLGGLILLMLNEGVDDDIILIFGFLLFSSL